MNNDSLTRSAADRRYSTALKPGLGLGLFFCLFLFMLVVASMSLQFVLSRWGDSTAALRIVTIVQDVFVFILPPTVTALMMTRLPAEFLEVMKSPKLAVVLVAVLAMLVAIPAMNLMISWNASLPLPESFAWMKTAEENAQATLERLMGAPTGGNLVMSLLIVGCLTGFAEELFFRGGVQKLLLCTRMNPHVAIWLAAVIFSLFHMQVLGFVPRVLLGAFFGYLMWWSGSLWLAVIAHAFNNMLVVAIRWAGEWCGSVPDIDAIGTGASAGSVTLVVVSTVLTGLVIVMLRRLCLRG